MGLFDNLSSNSSSDYKSAFNNINNGINNYSGNAGYENSLNQAKIGAGTIANDIGAKAAQASRNAGLSKAQAAALGSSSAATNYANNLNSQQQNVMSLGNQNVANSLAQANLASAEKQNSFNRANQNLNTITNLAGNLGSTLTALSDERCKERVQDMNGISKYIDNIDAYLYKYKDGFGENSDETNVGVMAQDLEKNPITQNAVVEDENGLKRIDTTKLTTIQMALISDLAKRVQYLEDLIIWQK